MTSETDGPNDRIATSESDTSPPLPLTSPSWHFAAVVFMTSRKGPDQQMRARAPMMVAQGFVMVLVQMAVVVALTAGSSSPSCESNDQCSQGQWCALGGSNKCLYCATGLRNPRNSSRAVLEALGYAGVECPWEGGNGPAELGFTSDGRRIGHVYAQDGSEAYSFVEDYCVVDCIQEDDLKVGGRTTDKPHKCYGYVYPNATEVLQLCSSPLARYAWDRALGEPQANGWKVQGVSSWCQACVHATDGTVDMMSEASMVFGYVAAMGAFDWLTLAFASYIISLTIAKDGKEIAVVEMAMEQAVEEVPRGVQLLLKATVWTRRYCLIPALLGASVTLVLSQGGDALSVTVNTVAFLFLLDVDNMVRHKL